MMDNKEKFSAVLVDKDGAIERVNVYVEKGIDLDKMSELVLESGDIIDVFKFPNVYDMFHSHQRKVLLETYRYDTVVICGSKTIHMLVNLREGSDEIIVAPTSTKVTSELIELHKGRDTKIKKRERKG